MIRRYTLGHHEDADCQHCGWPRDKGDTGYIDTDEQVIGCTKAHAAKAARASRDDREREWQDHAFGPY